METYIQDKENTIYFVCIKSSIVLYIPTLYNFNLSSFQRNGPLSRVNAKIQSKLQTKCKCLNIKAIFGNYTISWLTDIVNQLLKK